MEDDKRPVGGYGLPGVNDAIQESLNTAPFDPVVEDGAPWSYPVNRDTPIAYSEDPEPPKVPEPAMVRGFVAAVIGLIGYVVGKQIDVVVVDQIMDIYAVAAPLALAWWIRRNVTPVKRT